MASQGAVRPPRLLRRKADKKPVIAAFVPKGADVLQPYELELVPGTGLKVRCRAEIGDGWGLAHP